jgi:hypothetical protein
MQDKETLFKKILPKVGWLAMNVFGNYVIQASFTLLSSLKFGKITVEVISVTYWDAVVELYIFIRQLTKVNWLYYNWRISSTDHYSPIYYPNPLADLLTISFGN